MIEPTWVNYFYTITIGILIVLLIVMFVLIILSMFDDRAKDKK